MIPLAEPSLIPFLFQVKELKKILNDWDEGCDGCLEKGDFIKKIEQLKPKYVRDEL